MSNVLWGIPVVLVCVAGYVCACRLATAGRPGAALGCIMLCGLILRVYTGTDLCLHDWDERYHALVAKNLMHHWLRPTLYDQPALPYDYKAWTANHIWLHKQPLSLWLIALSLKLTGLHAFSVRIPAILLSTISIKLMYDISKAWYNRQVAMIAAFLFSIHGLVIELAAGRAGTDCVDSIFLFCIILSVWVAIKAVARKSIGWHLVLGAVIGLGILCKWLPALIAIPIWALIAWPAFQIQRTKLFICFGCMVTAMVVVALPWQLYILHAFPLEANWELSYNGSHFNHALEAHAGGFFYYFDDLRMKYGELIYLPVGWFTWCGVKSRKASAYAIIAWFWMTYLFFSIAATKMEAYTIIAAPAVFIITAVAFVRLGRYIKTARRYKYLLIAIWIGLIALPVRYCIERVKPFTALDRNPQWNEEILALQRSPANRSKTIIFNCAHPIETMFFTDCIAYEPAIDSATQDALRQKGYTVLAGR